MMNYTRFQDKIVVSRTISVIKNLIKNDMLDFNATKFFGINIRNGKVFHHLPMK